MDVLTYVFQSLMLCVKTQLLALLEGGHQQRKKALLWTDVLYDLLVALNAHGFQGNNHVQILPAAGRRNPRLQRVGLSLVCIAFSRPRPVLWYYL